MPAALQVISGFVTAPSTTATAITVGTGDSVTVRAFNKPARAFLLNVWCDAQTAGFGRILSPNLHDSTQGIRWYTFASEVYPLLPMGYPQELQSQDSLTVQLTGSATTGDIEQLSYLVYYEDLPGIAARLANPQLVAQRTLNIFTVQNTLSSGTAGGYSGEEAINAEFDLGKANTDYALLGINTAVEAGVVGIRGSDTGNLRVGVPGCDSDKSLTSNWFVKLSRAYNVALVPVFNYANKAGILLDCQQDENGADPITTCIFGQLAP